MLNVDGQTERRNARLQFVALLVGFAVVLYFVIPDHRLYLAMVPPLLVVLGYRSWAVERFSPLLAESYARGAVAGAGDAVVSYLRTDDYLAGAWAGAGADLRSLTSLPADRLHAAMAALRRDYYPDRRLRGPLHVVNRAVAATLGILLGGALARGLTGISCEASPVFLLQSLTWPVWLCLALTAGFRLMVAANNRRQLERIGAAIRAAPRAELHELLAPPWRGRLAALVVELNRLADLATGSAARRPAPELRAVSLLLAGGIVLGFVVAYTVWSC